MLNLALKYQGTLFYCDLRRFVRRSPMERYTPQCTKSSVKFGGRSMMVFGMISVAGAGPLLRLLCKIDETVYKEILNMKHVPNLRTAINQPIVFMQDNAPWHTVKSVRTFLSEKDVTVIEWPAQSPDMNPIENVWKLLSERVKEKNSRNVEGLWTNLKGEWEKIWIQDINSLV